MTSEGFPMANSPFMREKMRETSFPILFASLREIEHLVCRDSATLEAQLLALVQDEERKTWSLGSSIPRLEGTRNPILQEAFDHLPLPSITQELEARTSPP